MDRGIPKHTGFRFAVLSFLAYWIVRWLGSTLRYSLEDASGRIVEGSREVFIWAIWHNRIGIMPSAYRKFMRREKLATLVSASKDGELLARVLLRFGFQPVRGSSSRRGPQSLIEMVGWVERGYDAVITPDGPRGPAEVLQPGIITLSKLTGVPITPVSCVVKPCKRIRSWDRFIVPFPFARCHIRVGNQIVIPGDADDATMDAKRVEVEAALRKLGEPERTP